MVEETCYNNYSVYIEGYLSKKEEKWVEFWIVLEDRYLMIHSSKPTTTTNEGCYDRLIGWIEITNQTKCIMGKKKSYSFPFYIQTRNGKYLFKTPSTLLRHQWVKAIQLSSQGKSPEFIPKSLSEVDRGMVDNDDEIDKEHVQNSEIEEQPFIHNELNEAYDNEDNENLVSEEFESVNNDDENNSSNVILVTTGCENTKNFLRKKDIINNRVPLVESKNNSNTDNDNNDSHSSYNTKKNTTFLRYEKPKDVPSYTLELPSLSTSSSTTTMSRLSKSVDSVKKLDVLDSYRTNSDTSVRSPHKDNCRLFSRHLINESLSGEEMLTVL